MPDVPPGPRVVTVSDIVRTVGSVEDSCQRVVLGVVGQPGAGKSYVSERLAVALSARGIPSVVLQMDGFHLSNEQLAQLGLENEKGGPRTFDTEGLLAMLRRLKDGSSRTPIFTPEYDRSVHQPIAARGRVEADTRVVIVEGNYLLLEDQGWSEVRNYLTYSWYLDCSPVLREQRLLRRKSESGWSFDRAAKWVKTVDGPNGEIVASTRGRADFASDVQLFDVQLADGL